jgi:hypothetical protein
MTAKDELDMFRAGGQYSITLVSLGIYAVVLALFLFFMHKLPADQRLTIAVLLLTPLAGIINSAAAFWLNRSREDGAEKPPTITASSTPGGGSQAIVTPAGNLTPGAGDGVQTSTADTDIPAGKLERPTSPGG